MTTDPRILVGDCREQLRTIPDGSIDAIVTDPPYELKFMGKGWDSTGIAYDSAMWAECLRVLKPGGHLLAFGATRTYHRIAAAIEDAGFEIRDSIHWLYGSGFPKSLDVSKAIDKAAGHWRGKAGPPKGSSFAMSGKQYERTKKGDPVTPAAAAAGGWGTALKPAHEPIVVARKPLVGTVAANVLAHGTGALNIDGCRVGAADAEAGRVRHGGGVPGNASSFELPDGGAPMPAGRWPANLVLTHAAGCADTCTPGCPVAELDAQSGITSSGSGSGSGSGGIWSPSTGKPAGTQHGDTGGASRFFTVTEWHPIADAAPFRYVAKPGKKERNAGLDGLPERLAPKMNGGPFASPTGCDSTKVMARNIHPTVKPVALMRWLIRLVTPPGGTVLDPFLGSGTTAVAATLEGFAWIGCELTDDYLPIIEGRTTWATEQHANITPTLFGNPDHEPT